MKFNFLEKSHNRWSFQFRELLVYEDYLHEVRLEDCSKFQSLIQEEIYLNITFTCCKASTVLHILASKHAETNSFNYNISYLISWKSFTQQIKIFQHNFQNLIILCNAETLRSVLSVLGFKVLCAIYGRRIHHPGAQLARPKLVLVTRGVRFSHNGNFSGTFLCFLHGNSSVIPTSGIQIKLLFANTYVILANKVPKRQFGFPVMVKTTCSPLPFFSLSLMVSSKMC